MLIADSNADFVKLYQAILPTRLHLTSNDFEHTKIQIYYVLTSSSISIYTLYKNKEREHNLTQLFIDKILLSSVSQENYSTLLSANLFIYLLFLRCKSRSLEKLWCGCRRGSWKWVFFKHSKMPLFCVKITCMVHTNKYCLWKQREKTQFYSILYWEDNVVVDFNNKKSLQAHKFASDSTQPDF